MNREQEKELQLELFEQIKSLGNEPIVFWGASNFLKDFLNEYDISFANIKGIIDRGRKIGFRQGKYYIFHPNTLDLLGKIKIIFCIQNNANKIYEEVLKEIENTQAEILPNIFADISEYTKNETENERIIRFLRNENDNLRNVIHDAEKNIIYYLWMQKGNDKELIKILDKLNNLNWIWQDRSNEIWLIYLSLLIQNKKIKKAKEILKKYIKHFDIIDLERFLPISDFAYKNGINDENIKKSALIFEKLEKDRKNKTFEKLIRGKTVAVVGNGPSEIGKKKGKEIDSHDIVIRMNNYQTKGFEEDYGEKTDIWVRGFGTNDLKDYTKTKKYLYAGLTGDYFHPAILSKAQLEILYRDTAEKNIPCGCVSIDKYYDLINEYSDFVPTSGLALIYTILKLGVAKKLDIYGFSFNQTSVENISTHYFKDRTEKEERESTYVHNFYAENDFLRELFRKENDKKNLKHFIKLLFQKKKKLIPKNPKTVHFITFRKFFPHAGAGGGGAVQSANKVIFGDKLEEYNLKFSFTTDDEFKENRNNDLWDLFSAIEFVKEKTKNDTADTVYITHDYGSAFGLYLLGKKYALISHIQGSRVEEKINFGEKFSFVSKKVIQYVEKTAMKNAYCVCYPSNGAYEYFCRSKLKTISKKEFKKGDVLYNTLYYIPKEEKIENIEKNTDYLTFLSVGQFTVAKGMDRHPKFFEELLKTTEKKIRYIMVGRGPLEQEIIRSLDNLRKTYKNFHFIHIQGCTYSQIQYLQSISDIYLMLHRISIFDLATLEVMKKGKCIILSNVGGNKEFDKDNNILFFENDFSQTVQDLQKVNINEIGEKNKKVYERYFSPENFKNSYLKLIENLSQN